MDDGKHYKVYENGLIEGFSDNAVVLNRIQQRFLNQFSRSHASESPTSKETFSLSGQSQVVTV